MDSAPDTSELELLVAEQQAELAAARAAVSDFDLAFRLQLEEAMTASLSSLPSCSSPSHKVEENSDDVINGDGFDDDADLIALQALEFERYRQEREDAELRAAELRSASVDLLRCAHDGKYAREVATMPDHDWENYGDDFERPFDDQNKDFNEPFRLYFKGMYSNEHVQGKLVRFGAIGAAVCDPNNKLVLKVQKPVADAGGMCREVLEAKALVDGLNAVISLGIKRINVFFDFKVLYNHVTGKWPVKQKKIANSINQVILLSKKLECNMFLLPRCHLQFVFRLARDVIDAQISKRVPFNLIIRSKDICNICLEETDPSQMFSVDGCLHRFCFSCMKQHVEVKLLHGMLPACPHDGCRVMLSLEGSRKFLSDKLYAIMFNRIKEASIPATEKLYCPYPKCSVLMSKDEAIRLTTQQEPSSSRNYRVDVLGLRKCIKCSGLFCIYCKVPWHTSMSCNDYKRINPHLQAEDAKLESLARHQLWRQCVKCKHMIELAEGCFHITCRCGYEFCYTCGAEWKNKKATCSCPLWDERRILYDDNEDEDSDGEDSYYYESDDAYDDDYF